MNVFLLVLGMLMEGFSAILVAVPLILPFVAKIGQNNPLEKMSPFQLAMIFLLNLEIAYCMPPLGLNLFISSFRFNRPVASLYRVVMPFVGILVVGLAVVSYVPWFSNVAVAGDVAAARAKAEKDGIAPRDAWMMECVQEDPSNPQPCSPADMQKYPGGQLPEAAGRSGRRRRPRATPTSCRTPGATPTSRTARGRSNDDGGRLASGTCSRCAGRQARGPGRLDRRRSSDRRTGACSCTCTPTRRLSRDALLVPPMLTTRAPWSRGLFVPLRSEPLLPGAASSTTASATGASSSTSRDARRRARRVPSATTGYGRSRPSSGPGGGCGYSLISSRCRRRTWRPSRLRRGTSRGTRRSRRRAGRGQPRGRGPRTPAAAARR